jgi:hypothetical protein
VPPVPNPLLQRLQSMDAVQVAALLEAVPGLAASARGRGPLNLGWPHTPQSTPPSTAALARSLASPTGVQLTLVGLDAFTSQLAELAAWHDGSLTREAALAETDGEHAEALDRSAALLRARLLAEDETAGWLVLRPIVTRVLAGRMLRARDGLQHRSRADLATIAGNLGAVDLPRLQADRLALVEAMLRRREVLERVMRQLPEDSGRLLNRLIVEGPQAVRDLGISYVTPHRHPGSPGAPLLVLRDCGLVDIDFAGQTCAVFDDVVVGSNGGRRSTWWPAEPPDARTAPLVEAPPRVPPVVERFDALLRLWATEPAEALANGGLGVRPVRAAAKRLGRPAGEVGLLAHLAIRLGVLGRLHVKTTGRGRAAKTTWRWTTTDLSARWEAEPAPARWARLVQAWRDDVHLDEGDGLPERTTDEFAPPHPLPPLARASFLTLLVEQPEGGGLEPEHLRAVCRWRMPTLLDDPSVDGLVAVARVLGLVPPDGPVGLSGAARALLDGGVDALAAALPEGRSELVVQADLTVITPPDADPDLTGALARYADLESDAGARIWRLSEARLMRALDDGESPEEVEAFLREHATAGLPQNVIYLLADVGRRHGRVRAGSMTSYVRSDDPALLSAAVAVRGAKLRLLAPTVAVSPLTRAKLVAALRDRGVSVVAEDADGATITTGAKAAIPVANRRRAGAPELPPLRPAEPDPLALAHVLLEDTQPDVGPTLSNGLWFDRDAQGPF